MEDFDSKMNKHISKVLELQRSQESRPMTMAELKELDLSMGMTENEWEALMQKADEYAETARSHFSYNNFIEAYKAADQAVSINPYHEKALIIMAQAAIGKYEADDTDEFLDKAELHAAEILKISKNNQSAIQVLAQVRKYKRKEKNEKKRLLRWVGIAAGIVLIIIAYFVFRPEPKEKIDNSIKFALIESEEAANAAWAQVENVISRRDQMLPDLLALANNQNPENQKIKEEIEALRKRISSAENQEDKIVLQAQLQDKIKAFTASLNNTKETELILVQIEGSYNRIAVEGKRFNEVAKKHNILIRKHQDNYPEFKTLPYFKGN